MTVETATVRFTSISDVRSGDVAVLRKMAGPSRRHDVGEVLQASGAPSGSLCLLLDGWAESSVVLTSGARQILKIHVAGDLLGLQSLAFAQAVDTITTLTAVTVCDVTPDAIGRLFADNPRLAAILFLISQQERVFLIDQLAMLGRADTNQRIAALLIQIHQRLARSDPQIGFSFRVPLTQAHIADMVGATPVHVSRVFQDLALDGLVVWSRGMVRINDYARLLDLAALPGRILVRDPAWLPGSNA